MRYWILKASGMTVSRTTIQRVTDLETCNNARKKRFKLYDNSIKERFHEKYTGEALAGPNSTNPTMEMWAELAEYDKEFQSDLNKVFENPDVKEADDEFTPYLQNNYVNMELILDR